jgi:hypothetical protein
VLTVVEVGKVEVMAVEVEVGVRGLVRVGEAGAMVGEGREVVQGMEEEAERVKAVGARVKVAPCDRRRTRDHWSTMNGTHASASTLV